MTKKYSINTASSNVDEDSDGPETRTKYTEEDLRLTNVQLLEKESGCTLT